MHYFVLKGLSEIAVAAKISSSKYVLLQGEKYCRKMCKQSMSTVQEATADVKTQTDPVKFDKVHIDKNKAFHLISNHSVLL